MANINTALEVNASVERVPNLSQALQMDLKSLKFSGKYIYNFQEDIVPVAAFSIEVML